jgi:hypothetical protein
MAKREDQAVVNSIAEKVKSSNVFLEAFKVAREVIPEVSFESLQHPEWTDADRRREVVARVKSELAADYPNSGWWISIAVDFAVDHLRDQLRKK